MRYANFASRIRSAFLSLAFVLLLVPVQAHADCASDGTCTYVPPTTTTTAATRIYTNLAPTCEVVSNYCGLDIMVPHLLQTEWDSFNANHESCAHISDCLAGQSWIISGWGACSASCGGGTQTAVSGGCYGYDSTTNSYVSPIDASYCSAIAMPTQACNTQACVTYHWGDWGACSASCGIGTQMRTCVGSDGSTGNDPSFCGSDAQVQTCNTQACSTTSSCTAANANGGSFMEWQNWANPQGPACAAGCTNPNPVTGACTCPAGYTDGMVVNSGGSIGHEGCTGYTHTCILTCGGTFLEFTDGKNPFGPACNGGAYSPANIMNNITGFVSCPAGFSDTYQYNYAGSVGHEGCTGFKHTCTSN